MLSSIRDINESGRMDERCTVGSADVTALYPSIDVDFAAERVCEVFLDSEVNVAEVDTDELGLYLALNRTEEQLKESGLDEYCPVRKTNRGRPPRITGCAQSEKVHNRYKPWNRPVNGKPDEHTTKRMLSEALAIAVRFVMKNHIYMFNGQGRQQMKGGPIGLGLTGDVAQVLMSWWDMQLMEKLDQRGMEVLMYKRLVDDVNMVLRKRDPHNNEHGHADKQNMEFVRDVADEIHPSIQVTIDYPSKNTDGRMPILDLKVWTSRVFDEVTHEVTNLVFHEFYSKDVASKAVVNSRSAVPEKNKRTILTQEVIRVLRNCSRSLPWKDVCRHVEEFAMRMQFSGYTETYRAQVVRSALKAYDEMVSKDQRGEEPLYRPRDWKRVERAEERRAKKGEWFKGSGSKYETVIFVPATPGSELKKRYMETIEKAEARIAVAEVPGKSIQRRLQRSDPFKGKKCGDPDRCMVCTSGGSGCRNVGITYEVRCNKCGAVYIGETGRNAYTRGLEHLEGINSKNEGSVFHIHSVECHDGELGQSDFTMRVTGVYGGDATKRQVAEAVRIQHAQGTQLLNRQDEWRQVNLPHVELGR